jgi:hypothetical protein
MSNDDSKKDGEGPPSRLEPETSAASSNTEVFEEADGAGASEEGAAATAPSSVPEILFNRRPDHVSSLLVEADLSEEWYLANRQATRFYLVNLPKVLLDLNLNVTGLQWVFRAAERAIADETRWSEQFQCEYLSSHTQILDKNRFKPKLFGRCATIIVAMELAAKELKPGYNVYDYLRIVPATFFIDRFSLKTLRALDDHYVALSAADRQATFAQYLAPSFEQVALNALDQMNSTRLLQQMASGNTATQWVCERLREFVAETFPAEFHLDVVRDSHDPRKADAEPGSASLGTKNAAPALRAPRRRDADKLPPCY